MLLSLMYRYVNLYIILYISVGETEFHQVPCFQQMFEAIKPALPRVKNSLFSPLTCSLYLAIQDFIPYGEEQVPTYLSKDY